MTASAGRARSTHSLSAIAEKDHRHGVVGAAVLRAEAKPIARSQALVPVYAPMEGSHAAS